MRFRVAKITQLANTHTRAHRDGVCVCVYFPILFLGCYRLNILYFICIIKITRIGLIVSGSLGVGCFLYSVQC